MSNHPKKPPGKAELMQIITDQCRLNLPLAEAADQSLSQLGLDSLGFVELAMGLEDALGITLDLDQLSADTSLSVLVDHILASSFQFEGAQESSPAESQISPQIQPPLRLQPQWVKGVSFQVDLPSYSLRALRPADVNDDYVSWWNDAEIQSRLGAPVRHWQMEQARRHVSRFDTHHNLHLGIFDRAQQQLIGFYTIFSNPHTRVASTNRVIGNKAYWRKGVSRELSAWSIPFLFDTMGMVKISASIHGDNHTSMWLVEHFGFQREGVLRQEIPAPHGGRLNVYKYGLLADEWRQQVEGGVAPWGPIPREKAAV